MYRGAHLDLERAIAMLSEPPAIDRIATHTAKASGVLKS
jgi:hypothetical protein